MLSLPVRRLIFPSRGTSLLRPGMPHLQNRWVVVFLPPLLLGLRWPLLVKPLCTGRALLLVWMGWAMVETKGISSSPRMPSGIYLSTRMISLEYRRKANICSSLWRWTCSGLRFCHSNSALLSPSLAALTPLWPVPSPVWLLCLFGIPWSPRISQLWLWTRIGLDSASCYMTEGCRMSLWGCPGGYFRADSSLACHPHKLRHSSQFGAWTFCSWISGMSPLRS